MPAKERCGAVCRDGTPCQSWPVRGADRCRMHGGKSPGGQGGPDGNRKAVVTGEHESIFYDALDDDEAVLFDQVDPDKRAQLEEQLRLTVIRERRMLLRIQCLRSQDEHPAARFHTHGQGQKGPMDYEEETHESTLDTIQRIEESLTRVQGRHVQLVKELRKLDGGEEDASDRLGDLLDGLAALREQPDDTYVSPNADE